MDERGEFFCLARVLISWHRGRGEKRHEMGWNFGCLIVDADVVAKVSEWLEPERRQFMTGHETPEEAQSKRLIDVGTLVFQELDLAAAPDDAPITFSDASSRYFDGYAAGIVKGKTVLVGRRFGLDQESPNLVDAYARLSQKFGPVYAFWCNDASDTYMFSVFREGQRFRFFGTGPGIDENHGAPIVGERDQDSHGHDRLMALLEVASGCTFGQLDELVMERFSPC